MVFETNLQASSLEIHMLENQILERMDYQLINQRYNHEYNLKFKSKVSTNILFNNMNKLEAV